MDTVDAAVAGVKRDLAAANADLNAVAHRDLEQHFDYSEPLPVEDARTLMDLHARCDATFGERRRSKRTDLSASRRKPSRPEIVIRQEGEDSDELGTPQPFEPSEALRVWEEIVGARPRKTQIVVVEEV